MRGNNMQDIIFLCGGSQLGFMAHGRSGFHVAHDVSNNSYQYQTRFRLGSHIRDPNRVSIGQNAIYDGVLNGGNGLIMTVEQAKDLMNDGFELADEMSPAMYSICMPRMPYKTGSGDKVKTNAPFDNSQTIINIRGYNSLSTAEQKSKGDYPGCKYVSVMFGFDQVEIRRVESRDCLPIAPMSFKGTLEYPTAAGMQHEAGKGHHGDEYPKTREVRRLGVSRNPVFTSE